MSLHRARTSTAIATLPAADLIATHPGTGSIARHAAISTRPARRMSGLRRAAVVGVAGAVILGVGAGAADAATPRPHPGPYSQMDAQARLGIGAETPDCGPGYYPWSDYGRCVPIHKIDASDGQAGFVTTVGEFLLGGFALVGLLIAG